MPTEEHIVDNQRYLVPMVPAALSLEAISASVSLRSKAYNNELV